MRAVAAASGALHCAISPAPTKTCGVPGAATIAVRVSEAVRPLAPMTPTRTAKAPGFVYRCVAATSAEPESSGAVPTALSPHLTVHAPGLPPIATRAVSWARTSGRGERSTTRCWYSGPGEHGRRAIDD